MVFCPFCYLYSTTKPKQHEQRYAFYRTAIILLAIMRVLLISINCEEPPKIHDRSFQNFNLDQCSLYVPKGCKPCYQKADGWKDFKKIVKLPRYVYTLCTQCYKSARMLHYFAVPLQRKI